MEGDAKTWSLEVSVRVLIQDVFLIFSTYVLIAREINALIQPPRPSRITYPMTHLGLRSIFRLPELQVSLLNFGGGGNRCNST